MTKKKQDELRIERAYGEACSGIQIDVLDITKVFEFGQQMLDRGCDDAQLRIGLRAFVETIKRN